MASLLSNFSLPKPKLNIIKASASVSAPSTSNATSTSLSLDEQFGRKGIKFIQDPADDGDSPMVQLTVRNGSSLCLRIPDGHVTSYKPKVYWKDDGFEEVLHTITSMSSADSSRRRRGGLSLVLNDASQPQTTQQSLISNSKWDVKAVDSDSIDALQVELSCTTGSLDISYIVSLYPLSMVTAVVVKNDGKKAVSLTSAMLSHLKFKTRGRSAIKGLTGCSYSAHPPLTSNFELLSPAEAMKPESDLGWFSMGSEPNNKPGVWNVEDNLYTILKNKMSRVYTAPPKERLKRIYNTPPTKYETIDQGKGLVFRIIRMGYEDIYISSPGSTSEKYGNDYFICTGPATMVVPAVLNPGEDWRGAQVIEHDNLYEEIWKKPMEYQLDGMPVADGITSPGFWTHSQLNDEMIIALNNTSYEQVSRFQSSFMQLENFRVEAKRK